MTEYSKQLLELGLLWGWGGTFLVLAFILYEIEKRIKNLEEEINKLKKR